MRGTIEIVLVLVANCFDGDSRKKQRDSRTLSQMGFDLNSTSRLTHEAINHRQAQAGAFSQWFGGEEWVECAFDSLARHSATGIGYRQFDIRPWFNLQRASMLGQLDVGRLNNDCPPLRHGVARVDAEVEQGVFKLIGIEEGVSNLGWGKFEFDCGADGSLQKFKHGR